MLPDFSFGLGISPCLRVLDLDPVRSLSRDAPSFLARVPRVTCGGTLRDLHRGDSLCGAGLLELPLVLGVRSPAIPPTAPAASRSRAPPLLPAPTGS